MRGVGATHGADPPVAPGLAQDPGAGVVAIVAVAQVFDELAPGGIAAPAILVDYDLSPPHEECCYLRPALPPGLVRGALGSVGRGNMVRSSLQGVAKSLLDSFASPGRGLVVGGQ